jgi:hypothetical protein
MQKHIQNDIIKAGGIKIRPPLVTFKMREITNDIFFGEKKLVYCKLKNLSEFIVRSNKPTPVKVEHKIGLEEFKKGGYAKKQKVVKVVQKCIH